MKKARGKRARAKKAMYSVASLSIAMTVVVTGCGSKTSSAGATSNSSSSTNSQSSGKTITVNMFLGKDTAAAQAQQTMLDQFSSEFEKQNPNIKVKYSMYSSSGEENTKLQTSLTTKQGPDLFEFGSTFIPTAFATKGFHEFTSQNWQAIGGKSRFFKSTFSMAGPSSDKLIAVPETVAPYGLLINQTLFKAAGITSPPKTWTEFVNDAKKMTDPSKNQWGTAMDPADSYDPWHIVWTMARDNGGNFVTSDGSKATMDSQPVIQAMQFWFDWMTKFKIASPNDVTNKGIDDLHQFENGKVGMLVMQSSNDIKALDSSQVKGQYTFVPMPTIPYGLSSIPSGGQAVGSFVSGQYLAVPSYVTGQKYQATLKFLNFLTSKDQQIAFYKNISTQPATIDAWKGDPELQTSLMKAFYTDEQSSVATPFTGAWGNIEVIFAGASSKIATEIATHKFKSGDIPSVLKAANTQVTAALQQK